MRTLVHVAHEALIRHWRLLRQWIEQNRDLLRQQHKIEASAVSWREQGQQSGYLLQGLPLIEATQFERQQADTFPLSEPAKAFIKQSIQQRRWNHIKTVGWLIIPMFIGVGVGEHYFREYNVDADYGRMHSAEGTYEERKAVEDLVQGCAARRKMRWLLPYLTERLFGNCRPLWDAQLNRAKLRAANLIAADLIAADLIAADLIAAIILSVDLRTTQGLIQEQLEGDTPPLICNSPLPEGIEIDTNRDCETLANILIERYPSWFGSLEGAQIFVDEQRQKKWD